jgi:hypothetical protein
MVYPLTPRAYKQNRTDLAAGHMSLCVTVASDNREFLYAKT